MKTTFKVGLATLALTSLIIAASYGCGNGSTEPTTDGSTPSTTNGATTAALTGDIVVDGSSTVSPIMEAVAEEFGKVNSGVKVTVSTSGTGGGFKKFSAGEIDIANASRPIEEKEIEACKAKGIEFIEIPIAFDGLSIVINPSNTFAESLTVAELKKIWEPDSKVKTWADVRAGFPATPIKLYGPGTDSGTFDYFTKAIVGKEKASRPDFQASEDDNVLVTGVSGDKGALGYFGYAYYEQNKAKLKLVKLDAGKGPMAPNPDNIADGTYQPLSRPLFIYVNKKALDEKPAMAALIKYILNSGRDLITVTGYVPLPDEAYALVQKHVDAKKTGTLFKGAQVGVKLEDILKAESSG